VVCELSELEDSVIDGSLEVSTDEVAIFVVEEGKVGLGEDEASEYISEYVI
jgi:hypothetical protein